MPDEFMRAGMAKPGPLAERREALGLTQGELAKLLGVELSSVVQWEHGGTGCLRPSRQKAPEAGSRRNRADRGSCPPPSRTSPTAPPNWAP